MAFLLLSLLSLSAWALETDNYLAWKTDLKDSSQEINSFFNSQIQTVLSDPKNSSLDCQGLLKEIGEVFKSRLVHDNPVENHLMEVLSSEKIFPMSLYYVEESIYRDPYRLYIPYFGLAPNIQVNSFYFGTDKLSHFASTGRIYYEIFQKEKSLAPAIKWGVRDEKSLHGYWASGIFSYADLEANYQGFLFYQNLCNGPAPYLQNQNGIWALGRLFRIQDYVSGLWDESYFGNYFLPGNWEKVSPLLYTEYCPLKNSKRVKERFRHYKKHAIRPSILDHQEELSLPKAQSFQELCQETSESHL